MRASTPAFVFCCVAAVCGAGAPDASGVRPAAPDAAPVVGAWPRLWRIVNWACDLPGDPGDEADRLYHKIRCDIFKAATGADQAALLAVRAPAGYADAEMAMLLAHEFRVPDVARARDALAWRFLTDDERARMAVMLDSAVGAANAAGRPRRPGPASTADRRRAYRALSRWRPK
jgi:hypothetical protein